MYPDDNNEMAEKRAFAEILCKYPNEPFKASLELFPDNTNRAVWVAQHWANDRIVHEHMQRMKATYGEFYGLPDRAELLRCLFDKMKNTYDANEYARLAKLYAEIRGYITKPGNAPQSGASAPVHRAIEVPTYGTDASWEQAAATQQRHLRDVSRSRY